MRRPMSIVQTPFTDERELQQWTTENLDSFVPDAFHVPGCQVTTITGKSGVPDGFAFSFRNREWYVIENELLNHGVWPHIAEQVVRFVVALQNPASRRRIRDRLFDALEAAHKVEGVAAQLGASRDRLLQQLELFIEGVDPQVLIFIDDTNQDLRDLAHALAVPTRIFRIQKFLVNGRPEFHSPDHNLPAIVAEPATVAPSDETEFDVVEILGGGKVEASVGRFKCYRMTDGSIIHVKRSKFHAEDKYYWYAISTVAWESCRQYTVSHVVFVMGDEGFAKVPVSIVAEFLKGAGVSRNQDGSVRHYHCLISQGPKPELYWSNEVPRFSLAEYYQPF